MSPSGRTQQLNGQQSTSKNRGICVDVELSKVVIECISFQFWHVDYYFNVISYVALLLVCRLYNGVHCTNCTSTQDAIFFVFYPNIMAK